MQRGVIKENGKSRSVFRSQVLKGLIISLICCSFCTLLLVLYLISFHRIQSASDLKRIYDVITLPKYDHRCRNYNSTHFICLPNVFFIGASKCGTTSLMDYLTQHPRIAHVRRRIHNTDKHREVHRFDRNTYAFASRSIEQLDEWASSPIVSSPNVAVLHYTPHYLYAPSVPFEMRGFYPKPEELKFIVMLRDPVERSLSSYWFRNSHLFNGRDKGSIEEFMSLADREMTAREEYDSCTVRKGRQTIEMNKESKQNKKGRSSNNLYKSREIHSEALKSCFGSSYRSKLLGSRHIDKGIYFDQIQRWHDNFPSHNFHFISLRKFEDNPLLEYSKLLDFIFHSEIENNVTSRMQSISELKANNKINDNNNNKNKNDTDSNNSYNLSSSITASSDIAHMLSSHKRLVKPNSLSATHILPSYFGEKLRNFYKPYNNELEIYLGKDFF